MASRGSHGQRILAIAVAILACVLVAAAPARAEVRVYVNGSLSRGHMRIGVFATADLHDVLVGERVGKRRLPLEHPPLNPARVDPALGQLYEGQADDVAVWKCSRRTRVFYAQGVDADGRTVRREVSVRTPACANRLVLRARPGGFTVADSWNLGGVRATVCGPSRCRRVALARGVRQRAARLPVHRGDRVSLRSRWQRLVQRVGHHESGGPTVLTTGDSMMQSLDQVLSDWLASRLRVVSDVHVGSGLTRVDGRGPSGWIGLAREQVAESHPRVTLITLGADDGYPITRPDGIAVECCGPEWSAEWVRRARKVMRIYTQGGAGTVIWLAQPTARDEKFRPLVSALNPAIRQAASTVPGVYVEATDHIFTPGDVYRAAMPYRGRRVRVREADGFHFNQNGARIAADYLLRRLRGLGIVTGR